MVSILKINTNVNVELDQYSIHIFDTIDDFWAYVAKWHKRDIEDVKKAYHYSLDMVLSDDNIFLDIDNKALYFETEEVKGEPLDVGIFYRFVDVDDHRKFKS